MALEPKEAFRRLEHLKGSRYNWETHWQEVSDYVIPIKNEVTRITAPGEKRNLQVYDSTAVQSNELLGGALHGMLTNPSAFFFEMTTGVPEIDKKDSVRKWLQDAARIMHEAMNNSNFQTEIHEVYIDLGSFGTAVMSIEEDDERGVRFMTWHIRNCYLVENGKGDIDTIFRCFKWKARDVIGAFGDAAPKFVFDKSKDAPEEDIELLHVVMPRSDYDNKSIDSKRLKFSSCYFIKEPGKGDASLLEEKGFRNFPYVTPRWTKGTGETYGRSPAMKCLPDVKMINEMMKSIIKGAQKAIDPPLLVPDNGVLGSIRLTPGGLNYYRGGSQDFIRPLESGHRVDIGFQVMEDVRRRIRDCFFVDQLQLQQGPQMTATEVLQRTEEKIRLLGPILGRQQSELLRPLIDRIFDILLRKGKIPKPPQEILGMKLDVKYRSMLAKSQLASEASNLVRVFQASGPFLQIDPNAADIIDAEEGVRYVANMFGIPQELIRTEQVIKARRDARDQANQAALQQRAQQTQVDNASKLAPLVDTAMKSGQQ